MASNTKLVIGHYIWKNIPSLKPTKLHHTYDRKTEVQYGAKNGQAPKRTMNTLNPH